MQATGVAMCNIIAVDVTHYWVISYIFQYNGSQNISMKLLDKYLKLARSEYMGL